MALAHHDHDRLAPARYISISTFIDDYSDGLFRRIGPSEGPFGFIDDYLDGFFRCIGPFEGPFGFIDDVYGATTSSRPDIDQG